MFLRFIARILPDTIAGVIDYYRFSERGTGWGGPFNGQKGRQDIFVAVSQLQQPTLVIETGTYLGTTTETLAATGAKVVTIEGNPRNFGFSKMRLRNYRNVSVKKGDSRLVAQRVLKEQAAALTPGGTFAYLDAHWNADLPLAEEVKIVFGYDPLAIVMIDDFEVPQDPGYGFDDYGPGNVLTRSYILPLVTRFGLAELYPAVSSANETGSKRGCVLLASEAHWAERLLQTGFLRRF